MGQPSGSITAANFPCVVDGESGSSDEWQYHYFIIPVLAQPAAWTDADEPFTERYYTLRIDVNAETDTDDTLTFVFRFGNGLGQTFTPSMTVETTATAAAWGSGDFPEITPFALPHIDVTFAPVGSFLPAVCPIEMAVQKSASAGDSYIYGIHFEWIADMSYGHTPTGNDYVEVIERSTAADMPYGNDRPMSSWMVQALCHSENRAMYEHRMCYCQMIYGRTVT